jgi:hypothetical protein
LHKALKGRLRSPFFIARCGAIPYTLAMPKSWITPAVVTALALLALPCQAAIYKYVDSDGNITFTDKYRPGAVKIAASPDDSAESTTKSRRRGKSPIRATPANFPRVDAATQQKRDDVRRTLLLEERGKEEKSLAAAKTTQASGKGTPDDRKKQSENIRLHEKNIELLDAELARIK